MSEDQGIWCIQYVTNLKYSLYVIIRTSQNLVLTSMISNIWSVEMLIVHEIVMAVWELKFVPAFYVTAIT